MGTFIVTLRSRPGWWVHYLDYFFHRRLLFSEPLNSFLHSFAMKVIYLLTSVWICLDLIRLKSLTDLLMRSRSATLSSSYFIAWETNASETKGINNNSPHAWKETLTLSLSLFGWNILTFVLPVSAAASWPSNFLAARVELWINRMRAVKSLTEASLKN